MIFSQQFAADLDAIDWFGRPFALARFADGEWACIRSDEYTPYASVLGTETWRAHGKTRFRSALIASLECQADDYCVGISTPCCQGPSHRGLAPRVRAKPEHTTFATLFSYGNRKRFQKRAGALGLRKRCVLVAGVGGDLSVPLNAWNDLEFDLEGLVMELQTVRDRPILVAAGPMAGPIVHRYWMTTAPRDRCVIIDIGSAWDEMLHGRPTRMDTVSANVFSGHVCRMPAKLRRADPR